MSTSYIIAIAALNPLALLCLLMLIRWLDRYEREPIRVTLSMFALGAVGAILLTFLLNRSLEFILPAALISTLEFRFFIKAPLIEEFAKAAMFIPVIISGFWAGSKLNLAAHIDNETDGLLYGAAIGLGFAATENIIYLLSYVDVFKGIEELYGGELQMSADVMYGPLIELTVARILTPLHAVSTALVGWTIGHAMYRRARWRWLLYPAHGWALAVILHSLWNRAAIINDLITLSLTLALGVIFFLTLMQLSLRREHKILHRYLRAEAARGTLPADHAAIIPFWRRRIRGNWLAESIPKPAYIKATTLLAMRLHQRDLADDSTDYTTSAAIDTLRRCVRELSRGESTG